MSITSSSMLVELNISVWTASKLDKETTNSVTETNAAVKDAATVHKNLMAGTTLRKEIADYAAGCRLWHNTQTLPWSDKGARLMPTSLFLDYKAEANKRRDKFEALVAEFVGNYPDLIQTAQRQNMGGMFRLSDYPSVQEVADKFGFRLVFSPVPEAGDFRLDVPQQDLEEIKRDYETSFNARLADAMRSPWEQLHKLVGDMSKKLTDVEGDETKKRYHDTLVTNAQSMCSMLTHLNVAGDPQLEEARRQLEATMLGADIDDIKESPVVRADIKTKLDAMLKKYEW